jgi:YVTN family beta-propeller protein
VVCAPEAFSDDLFSTAWQPFSILLNSKARYLSPALMCTAQILKEGFRMHRIGFLLALLSCACVLPSSAQTLVTTIPLPGNSYGISVNSDNNRIYVALGYSVAVIDGTTSTVTDTVSVPQGASFVAANLVTGRVYAAGCDYGQSPVTCGVTVIDGSTNSIVTTIPLIGSRGIGVQAITLDPTTNRIYVADDNGYRIAEISGTSNSVITYIETDSSETLGLAVDFSTDQILASPSGEVIIIINGSNNSASRIVVQPGGINWNVAANSFTNRAYVTVNATDTGTGYGDTLGVVDLVSQKAIANIVVGTSPFGVCVDYLTNKILVTSGNGLVEVDGKTNTVTGAASNAGGTYVDVNPVTRLAYVSSNGVVNVVSE